MSAHVTTFYSYSDAVTRDDLLAQVALALSAQGDRVLICDWDFISPGLPSLGTPEPEAGSGAGIMEWVRDWALRRHMAEPDEAILADLTARVTGLAGDTTLYLLPAHGPGTDPARVAAETPWHRFLIEQPLAGQSMLRAAIDSLGRHGNFDHVLLRCSCGLTDLGALLVVLVPHSLVLVGRYVRREMFGLNRIFHATQAAVDGRLEGREHPLRRVLVAGPVPDHPEALRAQRRLDWDGLFTGGVCETRIEMQPEPARLLDGSLEYGVAAVQVARQIEAQRSDLADRRARFDGDSADSPRPAHTQARIRGFEQRVAKLLGLMGYRVERDHYLDNEGRSYLVVTRKGGLRPERYCVEARDWHAPVSAPLLEHFADWLQSPDRWQDGIQGMYVAPAFSGPALALAQRRGVLAVTPVELERQLFDFGPYLERIKRRFEESDLARTYLPQSLLGQSQNRDLVAAANAWSKGQGRRLWLVLGDYGTGKSVFFRQFSYQLARTALEDEAAPVPIAIDLKAFPNAVSLESLLQEHFRKTLAWHGDPEIFLHLLSVGRAVLLLDAFDEMGTAALATSMEDQFRQLARAAQGIGDDPRSSRVLITCRTHFFRDHGQLTELADKESGPVDSQLGEVARALDADIDELALFDRHQIEAYLEQALGAGPSAEALRIIDQTYDLANLASRPVLLEMMAQNLPALLDSGEAPSPAALYRGYTDRWLESQAGGQLATTADQRRRLLEHLAFDLWGRPQHRMHFRDLHEALYGAPLELYGDLNPTRVDLDLRHASFLTRTPEGYYSFSHKSFREFFFARHLQQMMLSGVEDFAQALDTAHVSPEVVEFLLDLLSQDEQPILERISQRILSLPYRKRVSENTLRVAYSAACVMLKRQTEPDWQALPKHMASLMPASGGAQLAGADLDEVRLPFAVLANADLRGVRLTGADLSGADLSGAQLQESLLDGARLTSATLFEADFGGASLREVNADGADLRRSRLDGADLSAVSMVATDLRGSTMIQARCHRARFARAKLDGIDRAGADLTALTAPDAVDPPRSFGRALPREPQPFVQLGHSGSVESAVFSPDGDLILTASYDRTAALWDARTGVELRRFVGHQGGVTSASFSPDAGCALTTSHDRTARLWDVASGRELLCFDGHGASVFGGALSPDGTRVVTAGRDNIARLWDAATGQQLHRLKGHRDWLTSAGFTRHGDSVVTASRDGTVRVWNAATGQEERCLDLHGRAVTSAVLSGDGRQLLSASGDGTARLWDISDGTELRRFAAHGASVSTACFSPDERQVLTASADGTARLWDRSSGIECLKFDGHSAWVRCAVMSADGRLILTAGRDGSARLWSVDTGRELRRMTGSGAWVSSGALAADGGRALTAGRDGFAHLWDAFSGCELRRYEGHSGWVRSTRLSPDERIVATASHDRTVRLWDAASGDCLHILNAHSDWVVAVSFSRDGSRLVSAGADGVACIWEVFTGKQVRRIQAHVEGVETAVFSPEGRRLLTAGGDGTARIWELRSGAETARFEGHRAWVSTAVFGADGHRALTAGHDGTARLWDARSGRELRKFQGHRGWVTAARFAAGDRWVLTAGNDGSARIWDAESGQQLRDFQGHGAPVTSIEMSADGQTVLTTSVDCTARLWDADTGKLKRTLICVQGGWLSLSPDGQFAGAGTGPAHLSYRDPQERSLHPTLWSAVDLPQMWSGASLAAPRTKAGSDRPARAG
jgi:WD40 repeat protein